jgi:MFS superfamily sulfate permease-like transporter
MDKASANRGLLDQLAVTLSGLCLLHCLLLPFVVAFLPFFGQFGDDHLHAEMLIVVIPVSVIALALGYRRHRHTGVILAGFIGLVILTIGGTIAHSAYGLLADRALTVIGSVTLAVTHYRNFKLSKSSAHSAS